MIANLLKILKHVWRKITRCTVVGRLVLKQIKDYRIYLDEHPECNKDYIVFSFNKDGLLKKVSYSHYVFKGSGNGNVLNANVKEGNE